MDQAAAERVVVERLLGPDSLPVKVRGGEFVDETEVAELVTALELLTDAYRDRTSVPKVIALALVDVSTRFENAFYSPAQQERLEDVGQEIQRLAETLFAGPAE